MKRVHPDLLTLCLADVVGSYGSCIPPLLAQYLLHRPNINGEWIYVCLAPVLAPIYLVMTTVAAFPHYYSYMPQTWACYTIPFLIVCFIRRGKPHAMRLAILPGVMTLFVTALWLPGAIAASLPWRSPLEGKQAPDFTLTTLAGTKCTLSQEKGHVVLIDFWATTCPPCRTELRQTIAKLADDVTLRERGLRVWTIDVMDDADSVRKFMKENHYDFNVMLNPQRVATELYHPDGIPSKFLIARDGSIRNTFLGPETNEQLRTEIDAALK